MSKQTSLCKLMSVEEWAQEISALTGLKGKDEEILLGYMDSISVTARSKIGNYEVIKLVNPGSNQEITDIEKGKYDVEKTKSYLERKLNEMHIRHSQAEHNARRLLNEGKRNAVIL